MIPNSERSLHAGFLILIPELLKDAPTARRADHKVEVREATRAALTSLILESVKKLEEDGVAMVDNIFELYSILDDHVLRLGYDSEVCLWAMLREFCCFCCRGSPTAYVASCSLGRVRSAAALVCFTLI